MTQVKIFHTNEGGDIELKSGLIERCGGLETAVYLSLFGGNSLDDGRQDNRFNWWGNLDETAPEFIYRGGFESFMNGKPASSGNIRKLELLAERLLAWMIPTTARTITTTARLTGPKRVELNVVVNGDLNLFYGLNWGEDFSKQEFEIIEEPLKSVELEPETGLAAYPSLIQTAAPTHWFRMDEKTGFVCVDYGSDPVNLIYNLDAGSVGFDAESGTDYAGDNASSKHVDSVNDLIVSPVTSKFALLNEMTIEFDYYLESTLGASGTTQDLLYLGDAIGAGGDWRFELVRTDDPYSILFLDLTILGDNSADLRLLSDVANPSVNYPEDNWYHFSLTIDKTTTNTVNFRINNVDTTVNSDMGTGAPPTVVDKTFAIGGQTPVGSGSLSGNGKFQNVQIYDRVLTDTERTDLYNAWASGILP